VVVALPSAGCGCPAVEGEVLGSSGAAGYRRAGKFAGEPLDTDEHSPGGTVTPMPPRGGPELRTEEQGEGGDERPGSTSPEGAARLMPVGVGTVVRPESGRTVDGDLSSSEWGARVAAGEAGASGALAAPGAPGREERAVPGVITVLDGGVPWIRDRLELDQEWDRLVRTASTLLVDGRLAYEELDGAGQALIGVFNAARWTTGRTHATPVTNEAVEVTGSSLRGQLAAAQERMAARRADWQYATGVVTWLLWITGARAELTYPGWDERGRG
jgi:hypothetical protein